MNQAWSRDPLRWLNHLFKYKSIAILCDGYELKFEKNDELKNDFCVFKMNKYLENGSNFVYKLYEIYEKFRG